MFSGLVSPTVRLDGLADGADDADFEGDRFFADFDIEILRSVDDGLAPHHRSPAAAIKPAGQDLRAPLGAGNFRQYRSFCSDCQSFRGGLRG